MLYIVHQIAFALSLLKLLAPHKTIFGDFDILAPASLKCNGFFIQV